MFFQYFPLRDTEEKMGNVNSSDDLGMVIFIIIICAVIAVLLIIAVICLCRIIRRNREWKETAVKGTEIIARPPTGSYDGPLSVELLTAGTNWPILVRVVDASPLQQQQDGTFSPIADEKVVPSGENGKGFMLYRARLYFDRPGIYEVCAYSADKESETRTSMVTFVFTVKAPPHQEHKEDESVKYEVLPPSITPGSGEVTDRTHISIVAVSDVTNRGLAVTEGGHALHKQQIKYSLDGAYPYLNYNGPFALPMESKMVGATAVDASTVAHSTPALSGGGMRDVKIKAITIDGNSSSRITEVQLKVVSARSINFDHSIKAPVADIDALNPGLYFDHPKKRCLIYYYVVPLVEMRREQSANLRTAANQQSGKATLSSPRPRNGIQYDNRIVPLTAEVGEIVTWAVDPNHTNYKSVRRVYNVGKQSWSTEDQDEVDGAYTRSGKKSGRSSSGMVQAPDICLSCEDAKITFPEIPAAYQLRFTLDGSEPSWDGEDPNTLTLPPGGTCHPMRLTSGNTPQVELLARWFHVAPNGDVRFGHPLHRVFSCQ